MQRWGHRGRGVSLWLSVTHTIPREQTGLAGPAAGDPAPPAPWEGPADRAARSQPGRLVPESLVVKLEWNGAGDASLPSLPLRLHF